MLINVQKLRGMFDELEMRVETLESDMSYLKRGELPPLPAKQPDPEPEPTPKPSGGARHWGSGPGQMDCGTSRRWRNR